MGVQLKSMAPAVGPQSHRITYEDRSAQGALSSLPSADTTYGQNYNKFQSGNLFGKMNPLLRLPERVPSTFLAHPRNGTSLRIDMNGGEANDPSHAMMASGSRNDNTPSARANQLVEQIITRLKHAPFSKYIKGKQINVSMVSQEDLKKMGHYIPPSADPIKAAPELLEDRFSLGLYDPLANTVFINTDALDESPGLMRQVLRHEFLHAFNTEVNELEDGTIEIQSGVNRTVISADRSQYISRDGNYLNEGLTEYLRVKVDGVKPTGVYGALFEAVSILIEQVGEDVVLGAYFTRDTEMLRRAWEKIHGDGAYLTLTQTADALNDRDPQRFLNIAFESRTDDLMGFVTHGFEYFTMQAWGYSPEDRTRAPRQLNPSKIPQELRDRLEGVRVFTNLSKSDLDRFFINVNHEGCHEDRRSYDQYTVVHKIVQCREEGRENLVFIRYRNSEASLEIATIDDPHHPHFLGKTCLAHSWLSKVSLEGE